MTSSTHHLAQVNIAHAVAPPDHPAMTDFMDALEQVNAAADAAPGFVWRLQDDSGNATGIRFLGAEGYMVNMSVWQTLAGLENYMYTAPHRPFLRRRREWFFPMDQPATACWWVPVGHTPTVAEAEQKVTELWRDGTTDRVFALGAGRVPPRGDPTPLGRVWASKWGGSCAGRARG